MTEVGGAVAYNGANQYRYYALTAASVTLSDSFATYNSSNSNPRIPMSAASSTSTTICPTCLQVSSSCNCHRWCVQKLVEFGGRGLMARTPFDSGEVILTDPTPISIELEVLDGEVDDKSQINDEERVDDMRTNSTAATSPPSSSTTTSTMISLDHASNAADASIRMMMRLVQELQLGGRRSELIRELHYESLDNLSERDQPNAEFFRVVAREFVNASSYSTKVKSSSNDSDEDATKNTQYSLIERLLTAVKLNSFVSTNFENSNKKSMVLMLLIAAVNHSCQPNARLCGYILEAIRPITSNEQIFISYLNGQDLQLSTKERRAKLFQSWGFHCQCCRCTNERDHHAT